jgi:hypothetical protein
MLRLIAFSLVFGLLMSCSSQPRSEDANTTCNSGDCAKNLNKLAEPKNTSPAVIEKTKKKKKK